MIVFLIAVGIYLMGLLFYSVFGSGERQSWASLPDADEHTHTSTPGRSPSSLSLFSVHIVL